MIEEEMTTPTSALPAGRVCVCVCTCKVTPLLPQLGRAAEGRGLLSPSEELQLCHYYTKKLLELCSVFQPPVPRSALVPWQPPLHTA